MRALVTGGAGFIGSHLVDHLLRNGHHVVVLDDLSTGASSNLDSANGHPGLQLRWGSILEPATVDSAMAGCDTVFHLAAAVGVHTIVDHPLQSLRTNLHGTEIVLDTAARHKCRVLLASTSEIYGKNTADHLREDDDRILGSALKSRWSYATAKAIDELMAYCYWVDHGIPTVIVRPFNIVGPRQTGRYGMVVPRFIDQALAGEPIVVFGTGTQRRCFCSVDDLVPALVALISEPRAHGLAVNIGGTEEVSIAELAERVRRITNSSSKITYLPYEEAYGVGFEDMQRRMPDTTRAHELIGFQPTISLDQLLSTIVLSKARSAAPITR